MKILHYPELNESLPVKITSCNESSISEHKHDFFELVYVCEGKAEHIFENKTVIIQQGDFFLINLNSAHQYRKIGDDRELRVINCLFLPQFIDDSLKNARSFQDILDNYLLRYGTGKFEEAPTQKIFHDDSGFVGLLANIILQEFQEKQAGYTDIIRNLLLTLIIYLVRSENPADCSATTKTLRDVKRYVAEHYAEPLRLSDICKQLNFSLPYVSTLFRRESGITFRNYLIRVRIEKACLLLRASNMNIQEITHLIGYTDPAFFYKSFRREIGLTPDEYRRQHRESLAE